jgi:hypothetical protein
MTSVPAQSVLVAAFVAWAVYRRVRRNIGQQKLNPARIVVRLVILGLVAMVMLATGLAAPMLALAFAGGALLGVAFAFLGLHHTKFETTADGHYYTPNTYIGVALSALLVGRMAYRIFGQQELADQTDPLQVFQNPLSHLLYRPVCAHARQALRARFLPVL